MFQDQENCSKVTNHQYVNVFASLQVYEECMPEFTYKTLLLIEQ